MPGEVVPPVGLGWKKALNLFWVASSTTGNLPKRSTKPQEPVVKPQNLQSVTLLGGKKSHVISQASLYPRKKEEHQLPGPESVTQPHRKKKLISKRMCVF